MKKLIIVLAVMLGFVNISYGQDNSALEEKCSKIAEKMAHKAQTTSGASQDSANIKTDKIKYKNMCIAHFNGQLDRRGEKTKTQFGRFVYVGTSGKGVLEFGEEKTQEEADYNLSQVRVNRSEGQNPTVRRVTK